MQKDTLTSSVFPLVLGWISDQGVLSFLKVLKVEACFCQFIGHGENVNASQ